jgi:hypothetical protein
MSRSHRSSFGLALASFVTLLRFSSPAATAADQFVKAEIKGILRPSLPARGQPGFPVLAANGLEFELRLRPGSFSPGELSAMYGKTVIATGSLEKRQGADSKVSIVCVVEGKLKVVEEPDQGDKVQYLIGYTTGQHSKAKQLCEDLGLRVLDDYKPGQFLVVEPGASINPDSLAKLRAKDDVIRYVEPNQTIQIPRGESAPSAPGP